MSDNHPVDPSGNTEAFQAFSHAPEEPAKSNAPIVAAAVVVVLALVGLIAWLALS